MNVSDIINYRLYNQQITSHTFNRPDKVVSWFGAMQAQDYAMAKWTVGIRLPHSTDADVEQAINNRTIIRTWCLRSTLHFVAPQDVKGLISLVGPRILKRFKLIHNRLGPDESTFKKIRKIIVKNLQGGNQLTRKELFTFIEKQGISTEALRGAHILYGTGMEGLIYMGAMKGKQFTYTLLDEWLPDTKKATRDEALAKLTNQYFTSHGPATLPDFAWWAGLTIVDARKGLEMAMPLLQKEIVEGETYWLSKKMVGLRNKSKIVCLLSCYDEYFLGYKDKSAMLHAMHKKSVMPGNGYSPMVMVNGQITGTWRRDFKKDTAIIEVMPFNPLSKSQKSDIELAANKYGKFLGMDVIMVFKK